MQEVAGIEAFGRPGIEPRWTRSNKDGIGIDGCLAGGKPFFETHYKRSQSAWLVHDGSICIQMQLAPLRL
jgi:hypothetical protein